MQSFADLMFTTSVQALQEQAGSRAHYATAYAGRGQDGLGPQERSFIESRDSFYIASVSETGWPYLQHRGGAKGFLRVFDAQTLGFADYLGNRQFVTNGNLAGTARVSLFLMDYPRKARLKVMAEAELTEDPTFVRACLGPQKGPAPQRAMRLTVRAFDWNCPKYITPRFTETELEPLLGPRLQAMADRIAELEAALAAQQEGTVP